MSLGRQKDIALLLLKHGRGDLIQDTELYEEATVATAEGPDPDGRGPDTLADDLEEMGPTFVKLGQLLASRPDLLPPSYIAALERLQSDVAPFAADEARSIIEENLGVRVSSAFAEFEEEPVSAASLAQVHRARLRDGRRVVVKVQRPGIRETILEDMDALESLAKLVERHTDIGRRLALTDTVAEFRQTLLRELDFGREAQNLSRIGRMVEGYPRLFVPAPVPAFCGTKVLTMDYVSGTLIGNLSPVALLDRDRETLADELLRAYLDQILVHGAFHADPHPGNIIFTPDGRLALIDLGMVVQVGEQRRRELLRLLLALSRRQ